MTATTKIIIFSILLATNIGFITGWLVFKKLVLDKINSFYKGRISGDTNTILNDLKETVWHNFPACTECVQHTPVKKNIPYPSSEQCSLNQWMDEVQNKHHG